MTTKTVFIYNGTTSKGLKLINRLLADGSSVICVDDEMNKHKIEHFLNKDEFDFWGIEGTTCIKPECAIDMFVFFSKEKFLN